MAANGKQTSSQKRAELKRLARQCQHNIFEMLKIVDELLSDHEYVDQFGGEGPLLDHIEAEEFSHFGGSPKLGAMLRAYRHNPRRAIWEEHRFNVLALIELAAPAKETADGPRISWKAKCKELEAQLAQQVAVNEDLKKTVAELRAKCDALVAENGELKGRLAERRERYAA